jgi:acyl carrier protein
VDNTNLKQMGQTVIRLVAERGGVSPETITRETHFRDDLDFDSLDVVELTMGLEETFNLTIPDHDVEGLQTVGDVIDYVARRVAEAPAGA